MNPQARFPLELTFKILAIAPQIRVKDAEGNPVLYVKQKLLKLKEHVVGTSTTWYNRSEVLRGVAWWHERWTDDDGSVYKSEHKITAG